MSDDFLLDEPTAVRDGEELDVGKLESYLLDNLPHAAGRLQIEQFPSGFSNLTYLLKMGDRELVLRRPPLGNTVKSAHDMGREYRVLSMLCDIYEPAPRPFLFCDDTEVIGDEFYVMERCFGVIFRQGQDYQQLTTDPQRVRRLCESFTDNLASLHALSYEAAGLAGLGKPQGYVERQVAGWIKRYRQAQTSDFVGVDRLAEWIAENRPVDGAPALIHNDYKYDNIMLDPHDLTRIVAVLDWEMATVGDPLMDWGMTLAYWVEATDGPAQRQRAFGPTMLPGSLTRRELTARYQEQTGFEIDNVLFYYCFGLFKLAVIIQQIYARYQRGQTNDPRFAELDKTVELLGMEGLDVIDRGTV